MAWFGSAKTVDPAQKERFKGLAPAPLAPVNLLAANPPPDANLAASTAATAALDAARKQKKKARSGGTLLTPPAVGVQATTAPKSLLGL